MTYWLVEQRSNYDPGERDIDIALLVAQSVEDNLYKTPLKRWRDPNLADVGVASVALGPFKPSLLEGGWRAVSTPQDPSKPIPSTRRSTDRPTST